MAKSLEDCQKERERMTKIVYASSFTFVCVHLYLIWTVASR